jgi:hypothetical protein
MVKQYGYTKTQANLVTLFDRYCLGFKSQRGIKRN